MSNNPSLSSLTELAENVDVTKIAAVQRGILGWFADNRRDLPWRRSRDPYEILVSEVMLQQTQVDRVLPYYAAFLARFPTPAALASAPTSDVIKSWAGLGYNRRVINLQRTARHVVEEFGGRFPSDVDALRRLPGIGPYTAGAIACFAFEQDVVFLDTNLRRVVHRLFVGVDVPKPAATDQVLLDLATRVLPPNRGWEWNQGLMEFGALQCTARRPACVVCPVQSECRAYPAIQSAIADLPRGTRLKREAPFAGSNRFYRGRVLAALRDLPAQEADDGIDLPSLGPRVREGFTDADLPWLYEVVSGLARDGLARAAEESPRYDADPSASPGPSTVRIKLP
ncbi:MAG: A/G-specific adenine glycosylase [Chloroflexota bacterium]|nr:A/G-specific adenine glycosylase [Chloroflexota bacterium]